MKSERKYPSHEALAKLEAFCAYQERSSKEVLIKLQNWGFDFEESNEILQNLISKKFVDDRRFTEAFVSGKYKFKKWGRIKLKFELRSKGIQESLINEGFKIIDPELYFNNLLELAQRKWSELKDKDEWTKRNKLSRFLASKGYEMDLISDAVQMVINSKR